MGIEVLAVAAVISTAVSVVQTVQAGKNAKKQAAAIREARERQLQADREARAIETAAAKNKQRRETQRAAREEKVKAAKIFSQAENSGAGGSSGALASGGILATNRGAVIADAASTNKAIAGINTQRNASASAGVDAANAALPSGPNVFLGVLSALAGGAQSLSGGGLFKAPQTNFSSFKPTGATGAGNAAFHSGGPI